MSKSYAHQPLWVLIADATMRQEYHDHRHGPCDLLLSVEAFIAAVKENRTAHLRCGYEVPWERRFKACGCRMCTEHNERRADRRRSRHVSKVELQRQKNERTSAIDEYFDNVVEEDVEDAHHKDTRHKAKGKD
jgi:hypothetical protein